MTDYPQQSTARFFLMLRSCPDRASISRKGAQGRLGCITTPLGGPDFADGGSNESPSRKTLYMTGRRLIWRKRRGRLGAGLKSVPRFFFSPVASQALPSGLFLGSIWLRHLT
jgi:hypothetical protein